MAKDTEAPFGSWEGGFPFCEMMGRQWKKRCNKERRAVTELFHCLEFLVLLLKGIQGFECASENQRRIISSAVNCSTSTTMLDLRQLLPESNISKLGVSVEEVIHMVPDTVPVKRCRGGCSLLAHTCQPTQVVERQVEVMLVLARWPQGEHQVICSSIQVEDHLNCGCSCQVKPDDCSPAHYFLESICKCLCRQTDNRASCIKSGLHWDSKTCSCRCPRHTWTSCSTGYVFDESSSCSCVLAAAFASQSLLPSLVLLFFVLVAFLGGGFLHLRRARRQRKRSEARTPLHLLLVSKLKYEERKSQFEIEKNSCETIFLGRAQPKPRRRSC